jgi:ABC-type dipeptide/oligopeptide/nickel transport system permease component
MLRHAIAQARRILLLALLGGLLAATMVRLSPGFGTDEQDLSLALSDRSREALRAERMADANIGSFYFHYLAGLPRGNLGFSRTLNRPIAELLEERLPETLRSVAYGMAGGIACGLALAILTVFWRARAGDILAGAGSGLFLSVPAAVLALLFLWTGANGKWAIVLLVFPHVYRYAKNLLVENMASAHVLAARARGVSRTRILFAHVIRPVGPQLFAVAGVSASLAFGVSIPVEVICDVPGIGQLVWKAALGRDMPLLVTITILVCLMTMVVNAAADLFIAACPGVSHDTAG